ncbi:MAG: hypothetical protein WKF43_14555 [Acidimicrobiales bacterium]
MADLLPERGLRRGSVVAVDGSGATTLALALVAEASQAGSWTVSVGLPTLGLGAAAELGVDLERLVLVDVPPPAQWTTVVAALADAFDLVLIRPGHRIRPGDARRLMARVRERGGVLCHLPATSALSTTWPDVPDLTLTVRSVAWRGVAPGETGHGRLRSRRVTVEVTGRRGAARPRRCDLWLPGLDGRISRAAPRLGAEGTALPHERAGSAKDRESA